MFCWCCRDVQSGGSTSELRLGEDKCHDSQASHADGSTTGGNVQESSSASTATADGKVQSIGEAERRDGAKAGTPKNQAQTKTAIKGGVFKPPPKPEPATVAVPLTLKLGDKARRTSSPTAGTLAAGAYLMYDKENETLYCQWSTAPQPGALAWLMPVVQVPGHKFNVNKGKQVLAKDCQNIDKYLQGWVSFVKIVREYPSKFMLLENFEASGATDLRIFLLETPPDKGGVSFAREVCEYNKLYDLVKNVKAVAAVPASSTLLSPDEAIDSKTFLQRGSGIGAAVALAG